MVDSLLNMVGLIYVSESTSPIIATNHNIQRIKVKIKRLFFINYYCTSFVRLMQKVLLIVYASCSVFTSPASNLTLPVRFGAGEAGYRYTRHNAVPIWIILRLELMQTCKTNKIISPLCEMK